MGQGQRLKQNVCATRVSTATLYEYYVIAVVAGFHCYIISYELARRGVRRGSVKVSGSGGVQRVWAWSTRSV